VEAADGRCAHRDAEAALALAVDVREDAGDDGVPIGSLQGVAFPLADVAIGVSGGRNVIWGPHGWPKTSRRARPNSSRSHNAERDAGRDSRHDDVRTTCKGLGFTIEADASLYLPSRKGWSVLGGDPNLD